MNPDPKQLLQIIHNRGEQAAIPAAAQELLKWIEAQTAPKPVSPDEKH